MLVKSFVEESVDSGGVYSMHKKKILMVDDEESLGWIMKLNLEATGRYEVRYESKGTQGLPAARDFRPDLIFLDITMPDMEGSEVAQQIRSDSELQRIPIVFLTATITQSEVGSTGGVIGGQRFLAKPVSVQQLVDCIEKNTNG